ncbi:MAG: PKD-like domain-containing protein, partial [Bacteroidota bacterium]
MKTIYLMLLGLCLGWMPINLQGLPNHFGSDKFIDGNGDVETAYTFSSATDGPVLVPMSVTVDSEEPIGIVFTIAVGSVAADSFTVFKEAVVVPTDASTFSTIGLGYGSTTQTNDPNLISMESFFLDGTTDQGVVEYTVTPYAANGCEGEPFVYRVTVNPTPCPDFPTIVVTNILDATCEGGNDGSFDVTLDESCGGFYDISAGSTTFFNVPAGLTVTFNDFAGSAAGIDYTISVDLASVGGCSFTSDCFDDFTETVSIGIDPSRLPSIDITNVLGVACEGGFDGSFEVTVNESCGALYDITAGPTTFFNVPAGMTVTFSGLQGSSAGIDYTVSVTLADLVDCTFNTSCITDSTETVTIGVDPSRLPTIFVGNIVMPECNNDFTASFEVTVNDDCNAFYDITSPTTGTTFFNVPSGSIVSFSGLTADYGPDGTDYEVFISIAGFGGCMTNFSCLTDTMATVNIVAFDFMPPTLACEPVVNIFLDESGLDTIQNSDFLIAEGDNCTPDPIGPIIVGGDSLRIIDCASASLGVERSFFVQDEAGNSSDTCAVTFFTVDTIAPVITCPADVTIECDAPQDT